FVLSPLNYTFSGTGGISGNTDLVKSGYGFLNLSLNTSFSGITRVEQGALYINSSFENSEIQVLGGAKLGGSGIIHETCCFEKRSILDPGPKDSVGTLSFGKNLTLSSGMTCLFDASAHPVSGLTFDKIDVQGNLIIERSVVFDFSLDTTSSAGGNYPLISYTERFSGNINQVHINGIVGKKHELFDSIQTIWLRIVPSRNPNSVTWDGSGANWDLQNSENWLLSGTKTYFCAFDTAIFDQSGILNSSVTLKGDLPVGRIEIKGDHTHYLFTGEGTLMGNGDLVKTGTGSLVMESSAHMYTGKTEIQGGLFVVNGLSVAGQASSIGANPSADPGEFVVTNAKLVYSSSLDSYTDKGITLGGTSDTLHISNRNSTLSINGVMEGPAHLVKTGEGTLYLLQNKNRFSGGTTIEEGTLQLNDPGSGMTVHALGTGKVTFKGGVLAMGNTSSYTECTMDFEVPDQYSGTLYADQRCNYSGTLTGGGELTIVLPGSIDRTIFRGNWSDFSGTIHVNGTGPMRLASTQGYARTQFHLGDNISMYYSEGTSSGDVVAQTVSIGGLSGNATSTLTGENWVIGERGDSTTFNGIITGHSLTKTGSGLLKLTQANTYTGNTTVNGGTLEAANKTGSATGTGRVTVNRNGTLTGSGTITGIVDVETGGILAPGNDNTGNTMHLKNHVNLKNESRLQIKTNPLFKISDKIECTGKITLSGKLECINTSTAQYSEGDEFKLFLCDTIQGAFSSITPSIPGEGLAWDCSELCSRGVIKVTVENLSSDFFTEKIHVFPNPVTQYLSIQTFGTEGSSFRFFLVDIHGKIRINHIGEQGKKYQFDIGFLPGGIYSACFEQNDELNYVKIIKR
nr:autotransporter-associated beta strand repeat-containing protein [Prolixibacteraceae bacterium]